MRAIALTCQPLNTDGRTPYSTHGKPQPPISGRRSGPAGKLGDVDDPRAGSAADLNQAIENLLDRWREYRRWNSPPEAENRIRSYLLDEVASTTTGSNHALLIFELAFGLLERGLAQEAFLLLRWLAERYTAHRDADLAVRVILGLTDDCVLVALQQPEHNSAARQVLRTLLDHAATGPVEVDRALARALAQLAHLRVKPGAPKENWAADTAALWTELAERWPDSADPEMRERAAQGMVNRGFIALQNDDEPAARQAFAELIGRFGADRTATEEMRQWRAVAENAAAILDQLVIDGPEFQLDYLRRQRDWFPESGMDDVVEAARRDHVRSTGAVRSWACAGEPFLLLLRNFEITETSGIAPPELLMSPGDADHFRRIRYSKGDRVLTELSEGLPLVQVASTTAGELEVTQTFGQFVAPNRLYLPNSTWFDTVARLISVADQIIVWANEMTPSLERELGELTARGRADDTLVLLEPPEDAVPPMLPRHATATPLGIDHPALRPFPHRVAAADLAGRGVADCPPLMSLVDRLRATTDEPVTSRLARTRARLNATGQQSG